VPVITPSNNIDAPVNDAIPPLNDYGTYHHHIRIKKDDLAQKHSLWVTDPIIDPFICREEV
jgi:hypothetical protein